MKTSEKQISLFGEDELMSLVGDSLANHIQPQEEEKEKTMTVTSGQKCLEQYGRFNRSTSWGKMFVGLLIGMGDWYSTKCRLIWKLRATKSSRFYFQLVPLTHHTEGIEYGSSPLMLPTPTLKNASGGAVQVNSNGKRQNKGGTEFSAQLHDLAKSNLLPTPTCMDATDATANMKSTQVKEGSMHSVTLARYVKGMWPTPTAIQRDHPERVANLKEKGGESINSRKNGEQRPNSILDMAMFAGLIPTPTASGEEGYSSRAKRHGHNKAVSYLGGFIEYNILPTPMASDSGEKVTGLENQDSLVKISRKITGSPSQLNPLFVAEMMGFPSAWTVLPFRQGKDAEL